MDVSTVGDFAVTVASWEGRMATVLCVDDEPAVGVVLEQALTRLGHRAVLADSVDGAVKIVEESDVELILSDYRMPGATGLDLLAVLKERDHRIPVIMMTGYSSIEHAVISIKGGAVDYLTKPIRAETLEIAVTQALEMTKLRRENEAFRNEIAAIRSNRAVVGDSAPMRAIMETIAMVAPSRATVLLQGESGTGKELLARAIHEQSTRSDRPFISLNCAAMPEGLVESALFGHEKGAFTGATVRTAGAFERANGGTLLLDEISEMRTDLQPKLLRVLQEREFERVGGTRPIKVDVRVIATTNRDLRDDLETGRFRSDLYYRLNVVPIHTVPLRDRVEDIPLLVQHFARKVANDHGVALEAIPVETIKLLQSYWWPGNVRELANAVERALILSPDGKVRAEAFQTYLDHAVPGVSRTRGVPVARPEPSASVDGIRVDRSEHTFNLRDHEKIVIQRALVATGGNRTRAAQLLGISERTLRNKLNAPKVADPV